MSAELTIAEAAAELGLGKSTVRREIRARRLKPVRKYGHRTVRIPLTAICAYKERHTI